MEVKAAELLYALAGIMITFAGFSALLLAVRPAEGERLLDKFLAKTVMSHVFVLSGGALLPAVLTLYGLPESWTWRIASVLFALPLGYLQQPTEHSH